MKDAIQVFAVIRVDGGSFADVADSITVKEILPTLEQAVAEVERLNKLNADKGCRYLWQTTRYLPQGRKQS